MKEREKMKKKQHWEYQIRFCQVNNRVLSLLCKAMFVPFCPNFDYKN